MNFISFQAKYNLYFHKNILHLFSEKKMDH